MREPGVVEGKKGEKLPARCSCVASVGITIVNKYKSTQQDPKI
jgi:hypothetical protein